MRSNATILHYKLSLPQYDINKNITLKQALINFIDDLNYYLVKLKIKGYKDVCVVNNLYSSHKIKINREFQQNKIKLFVAINTFKNLFKNFDLKTIKRKDILPYKKIISSYIYELKDLVDYFKNDLDLEYDFLKGFNRNVINSFELFHNSEYLLNHTRFKENKLDEFINSNISLFSLRQALELKFRKGIGVYKIHNNELDPPKLKHDFYLNFILKNKGVIFLDSKYHNTLIHIFKWINYYIHYGIIPNIWDVYFVIDFLKDLFSVKTFYLVNGSETHSLYGSIRINDWDELKNKFNVYFKNSDIKDSEQYNIYYLQKPEAIILKTIDIKN